jgi:hypothetical protein
MTVSRRSVTGPLVAVGVGEVHEPPPRQILDRADVDTAPLEVGVGFVGVGHHDLHAADRTWRRVGDTLADRDRARRAGRGELHEAQLGCDPVIVIEGEPGANVELLRPIDVADRNGDQFELHVHEGPPDGW